MIITFITLNTYPVQTEHALSEYYTCSDTVLQLRSIAHTVQKRLFITPRPQPATRHTCAPLGAPHEASYTSSSLLLQEEEELVEVVDPVESRGSSCLFLFVEPSGFNGVLLQSEECFKEQPREHRWCEGEKQPQAR